MTFVIFLSAWVAVVVVVITIFNWDPLYIIITLLIKILIPQQYSQVVGDFPWNGTVGKVVRCFVLWTAAPLLVVNIRTVVVLVLTMGASYMNIQKMLLHQHVNYNVLNMYKQMAVEQKVLFYFEKYSAAATLMIGAFFINVCVAVIEIGIIKRKPTIAFSALGIGILTLCVVAIALNISCIIYEKSVRTKLKWKAESGRRLDRKYIGKILTSFRPISVPVGDMGIVTKEFKLSYFAGVLINTVNFLIGMEQIIER